MEFDDATTIKMVGNITCLAFDIYQRETVKMKDQILNMIYTYNHLVTM